MRVEFNMSYKLRNDERNVVLARTLIRLLSMFFSQEDGGSMLKKKIIYSHWNYRNFGENAKN